MKPPVQILVRKLGQGGSKFIDKAQIVFVKSAAHDFARRRAVFQRYAGAQTIEKIVAVAARDFESWPKKGVEDAFQRRRSAAITESSFQQLEAALGEESCAPRENFRKHCLLGTEMIVNGRQTDARRGS